MYKNLIFLYLKNNSFVILFLEMRKELKVINKYRELHFNI